MPTFTLTATIAATAGVKPGVLVTVTLVGVPEEGGDWEPVEGWIDGKVQAFTSSKKSNASGVVSFELYPSESVRANSGYRVVADGRDLGVYSMPEEDAVLAEGLLIDEPIPLTPSVISIERAAREEADGLLQEQIDNLDGAGVGAIDGGNSSSNYGGTTPIDGGGA